MADITLRAARAADMPEIARIATHYILNTVSCGECPSLRRYSNTAGDHVP